MFKDRVVEYPNRYLLEDGNGAQTGPYTLIRDEGNVSEAGTLLNAANLNEGITELIEAKFASGTTSSVSVAASAYYDHSVTFGKTFSATPVVVASFSTSSTAGTFGRCTVGVHTITTTGCKIRVFNGDSGTRIPAVSWVAVGI